MRTNIMSPRNMAKMRPAVGKVNKAQIVKNLKTIKSKVVSKFKKK